MTAETAGARPDLRDRPARPQNGVTVETDAEAVFRAAIAAGVLSAAPDERNRAGDYFCMVHDREASVAPGGAARFRHRSSRTDVAMTVRRAEHAA